MRRFSAGLATLAVFAAGCGDEPAGPEIAGGAGVRVVLPAEAHDGPVRVELWDDDNRFVAAPTCPEFVAAAAAMDPGDPLCERWRVEIFDLTGERVRFLPDVPWGGRAYVWDGVDDEGVPVADGYYATEQQCIDEGVGFVFRGNYYVSPQDDECRWRVWSRSLPAAADKSLLEFGPFPVQFGGSTPVTVDGEVYVVSVFFDETYTVRVFDGAGGLFEQEVALIHGEYVEVVVDAFTSVTAGATARAGVKDKGAS